MNTKQIEQLCEEGNYLGDKLEKRFLETHISWVVFSDKYAFKIKKPLKLHFLDYSTLDRRKENCKKELILNGRYSDIYKDVVEIRLNNDSYFLGSKEGKVVDFAVRMDKLSSGKKMDHLLNQKKVNTSQIQALATTVAGFHTHAEVINTPFDLQKSKSLFNDIKSAGKAVEKNFGRLSSDIIARSMELSDLFLKRYSKRFKERIASGFQRDVHGDLHSGNIFLYKKPVIFDGIEFNDAIRQVDLAYEVAFLCMDLENHGRRDLSAAFLHEYREQLELFENADDEKIFIYFKLLRANVRIKIHMLGADQAEELTVQHSNLNRAKSYLLLMKEYLEILEKF